MATTMSLKTTSTTNEMNDMNDMNDKSDSEPDEAALIEAAVAHFFGKNGGATPTSVASSSLSCSASAVTGLLPAFSASATAVDARRTGAAAFAKPQSAPEMPAAAAGAESANRPRLRRQQTTTVAELKRLQSLQRVEQEDEEEEEVQEKEKFRGQGQGQGRRQRRQRRQGRQGQRHGAKRRYSQQRRHSDSLLPVPPRTGIPDTVYEPCYVGECFGECGDPECRSRSPGAKNGQRLNPGSYPFLQNSSFVPSAGAAAAKTTMQGRAGGNRARMIAALVTERPMIGDTTARRMERQRRRCGIVLRLQPHQQQLQQQQRRRQQQQTHLSQSQLLHVNSQFLQAEQQHLLPPAPSRPSLRKTKSDSTQQQPRQWRRASTGNLDLGALAVRRMASAASDDDDDDDDDDDNNYDRHAFIAKRRLAAASAPATFTAVDYFNATPSPRLGKDINNCDRDGDDDYQRAFAASVGGSMRQRQWKHIENDRVFGRHVDGRDVQRRRASMGNYCIERPPLLSLSSSTSFGSGNTTSRHGSRRRCLGGSNGDGSGGEEDKGRGDVVGGEKRVARFASRRWYLSLSETSSSVATATAAAAEELPSSCPTLGRRQSFRASLLSPVRWDRVNSSSSSPEIEEAPTGQRASLAIGRRSSWRRASLGSKNPVGETHPNRGGGGGESGKGWTSLSLRRCQERATATNNTATNKTATRVFCRKECVAQSGTTAAAAAICNDAPGSWEVKRTANSSTAPTTKDPLAPTTTDSPPSPQIRSKPTNRRRRVSLGSIVDLPTRVVSSFSSRRLAASLPSSPSSFADITPAIESAEVTSNALIMAPELSLAGDNNKDISRFAPLNTSLPRGARRNKTFDMDIHRRPSSITSDEEFDVDLLRTLEMASTVIMTRRAPCASVPSMTTLEEGASDCAPTVAGAAATVPTKMRRRPSRRATLGSIAASNFHRVFDRSQAGMGGDEVPLVEEENCRAVEVEVSEVTKSLYGDGSRGAEERDRTPATSQTNGSTPLSLMSLSLSTDSSDVRSPSCSLSPVVLDQRKEQILGASMPPRPENCQDRSSYVVLHGLSISSPTTADDATAGERILESKDGVEKQSQNSVAETTRVRSDSSVAAVEDKNPSSAIFTDQVRHRRELTSGGAAAAPPRRVVRRGSYGGSAVADLARMVAPKGPYPSSSFLGDDNAGDRCLRRRSFCDFGGSSYAHAVSLGLSSSTFMAHHGPDRQEMRRWSRRNSSSGRSVDLAHELSAGPKSFPLRSGGGNSEGTKAHCHDFPVDLLGEQSTDSSSDLSVSDIAYGYIPDCPKRVSFSTLQLRTYETVLGDNPACSEGPPISLGWRYDPDQTLTLSVDEYERSVRRIRSMTGKKAEGGGGGSFCEGGKECEIGRGTSRREHAGSKWRAGEELLRIPRDVRHALLLEAGYPPSIVNAASRHCRRIQKERMTSADGALAQLGPLGSLTARCTKKIRRASIQRDIDRERKFVIESVLVRDEIGRKSLAGKSSDAVAGGRSSMRSVSPPHYPLPPPSRRRRFSGSDVVARQSRLSPPWIECTDRCQRPVEHRGGPVGRR